MGWGCPCYPKKKANCNFHFILNSLIASLIYSSDLVLFSFEELVLFLIALHLNYRVVHGPILGLSPPKHATNRWAWTYIIVQWTMLGLIFESVKPNGGTQTNWISPRSSLDILACFTICVYLWSIFLFFLINILMKLLKDYSWDRD